MTIDLAGARALLRSVPGDRVSIDKVQLEALIDAAEGGRVVDRDPRVLAHGAGTGRVSAALR